MHQSFISTVLCGDGSRLELSHFPHCVYRIFLSSGFVPQIGTNCIIAHCSAKLKCNKKISSVRIYSRGGAHHSSDISQQNHHKKLLNISSLITTDNSLSPLQTNKSLTKSYSSRFGYENTEKHILIKEDRQNTKIKNFYFFIVSLFVICCINAGNESKLHWKSLPFI